MFSFNTAHVTFDAGYNFWARSTECIKLADEVSGGTTPLRTLSDIRESNSRWALKGDARMIGFYGAPQPPDADLRINQDAPSPVAATQSKADVHAGLNQIRILNGGPFDVNNVIDVDRFETHARQDNSPTAPLAVEVQNIPTGLILGSSTDPVFLTLDDLDIIEMGQLSHKIFAALNVTCERQRWNPYIGLGASFELGHTNDCRSQAHCPETTPSRLQCSLSQWSMWIKAGFSFS